MSNCSFISDIPVINNVDVYGETIKTLNDLEVNLNASEIIDMKNSRDLWFDFIPLAKSSRWYNVRIGCNSYSIIRTSHHPGF